MLRKQPTSSITVQSLVSGIHGVHCGLAVAPAVTTTPISDGKTEPWQVPQLHKVTSQQRTGPNQTHPDRTILCLTLLTQCSIRTKGNSGCWVTYCS